MEIKNTLYVTNRNDWRKWLAKNHLKQKEVWLIYYRKETKKPRISYDDAVLEALRYGWIDSIIKKIDGETFAQRFCARKPKSGLSQMNKERIYELMKENKMTKWGLKYISHIFNPKTDTPRNFVIPADILKALRANKDAWNNFQKMPPSYQRIRIAYIEGRKRHGMDMYKKALTHFIKMTEQNRRIGFVKERRDAAA